MSLLRLYQSVSRLSLRGGVAGLALGTALLAAGAFASSVAAAPQDVCLPVVGCITTTTPTMTIPTVTLPTLPTSTTTTTTTGGGTTTTAGSGGGSTGPTTATGTTSTGTDGTATPGTSLTVTITVRVRGHGAKRAIELRMRLSKSARVSALLSRNGTPLKRNQFSARAGSSVWRLRLARTLKSGTAKLGLTYRSSTGEIARTTHRLRLPR